MLLKHSLPLPNALLRECELTTLHPPSLAHHRYHTKCIGITQKAAKKLKEYVCEACTNKANETKNSEYHHHLRVHLITLRRPLSTRTALAIFSIQRLGEPCGLNMFAPLAISVRRRVALWYELQIATLRLIKYCVGSDLDTDDMAIAYRKSQRQHRSP